MLTIQIDRKCENSTRHQDRRRHHILSEELIATVVKMIELFTTAASVISSTNAELEF